MADDLRRESEEFIRYCTEISRRIGRGGVNDIRHLLALYEQLRRALDGVSAQELLWADEQARRLVEKFLGLTANLEALRRLKSQIEGDADDDQARGGNGVAS
jgi:hypothetical protein